MVSQILHIVLPYHSWKDFCIEHRAPAQQNEYCRLPGKEEVMGKSWNESMFNRYGHRYGWVFSIVFAPFPFLVLIHCNLSQNCNYLKCVPFGSGPLVPNNLPLFGFGFPVYTFFCKQSWPVRNWLGVCKLSLLNAKFHLPQFSLCMEMQIFKCIFGMDFV